MKNSLTAKVLLLERTRDVEGDEGEAESKLEADISTVLSNLARDGADPPDLVHADGDTRGATGKRETGGDAGRKFLGVGVVLRVVSSKTLLVEVVLGNSNSGVNSKPVS